MLSRWSGGFNWKDLDGDGKTDILIVEYTGMVNIYRHTTRGLPNSPTERWRLPPNTAWFALVDAVDEPGIELLVSTGKGILFYKQKDEKYETTPMELVMKPQVFGNSEIVNIREFNLASLSSENDILTSIPLFLEDSVITYVRDGNEYKAGPVRELKQSARMTSYPYYGYSIGSRKPSYFYVARSHYGNFPTVSKKIFSQDVIKNKTIVEMINRIEKEDTFIKSRSYIDIDGDGNEDFVLWYIPEGYDPKTTFIIYLRRNDGALPDEPDQVLRCRGLHPGVFSYDENRGDLPFMDVNGDGLLDIVLAELKDKPLSFRSFLEMVTERGMDWNLTVRLFEKDRGFSNRPDFKMLITAMLPFMGGWTDFINLEGDFNGDGYKDLIVRNMPTRISIYFASPETGFFETEYSMTFDIPDMSYLSIKDLNGDKISDICVSLDIAHTIDTLTVFLSQKGN
jgi:hypothetical protein